MAEMSMQLSYLMASRWNEIRPVHFYSPMGQPYAIAYQTSPEACVVLGSVPTDTSSADRLLAIPASVLSSVSPRLLSTHKLIVTVGKSTTVARCESVVSEYPTITPEPCAPELYDPLPEGVCNVHVDSDALSTAFETGTHLGPIPFALSFTPDGVYGGGYSAMFKVNGSSDIPFDVPVTSQASELLTGGRCRFEHLVFKDGVLTSSTFSTKIPECSQETVPIHLFDRGHMLCTESFSVSEEFSDELLWRAHKAGFITVELGPSGITMELHSYPRTNFVTKLRLSDEPRRTGLFTVPARVLKAAALSGAGFDVLFAQSSCASDNPPIIVSTPSYEFLLTPSQRW